MNVVLSKREKMIAVGVGAALVLLVVDWVALTPYLDERSDLSAQRDKAASQLADATDIMARQRTLRPVWDELLRSGLQADASQAQSQANRALIEWAQSAGVSLESLRLERPVQLQQGRFESISIIVKATGPMRAVARFLWAIETSAIPLHVSDVQITPQREGTDDLSVSLGVSALCMGPPAQGGNHP